MEKFNFFKKTKDVVKVAGIVAISSMPHNIEKNKVPENIDQDKNNIEVVEDIENNQEEYKELDTSLYNEYVEKSNEGKVYSLDTSITKENIDNTINLLRQKFIKQIKIDFENHYSGENKNIKMTSHDHEIMALIDSGDFTIDDYLELAGKNGDSLFYEKKPLLTFEDYFIREAVFANESLKMVSEEDAIKYEEELKIRLGENYEYSAKNYRWWYTEKELPKMQKEYSTYKEDNDYSETREYHVGSTAYALLRSGAYDKYVAEGGDKKKLIEKILNDISNPKYYAKDSLTKEKYIQGKYSGLEKEVAWIISTWIELEKRGVTPEIYFGDKDSADKEPITLEKLEELNKYSACRGTHALHASTMYAVHKNDTVKLEKNLREADTLMKEEIGYSEKFLKEKLNKSSIDEQYFHSKITYGDLAHILLSFTELPEDFEVDPEIKADVKRTVLLIINFSKVILDSKEIEVSHAAHVVDVLENLPKWIFED